MGESKLRQRLLNSTNVVAPGDKKIEPLQMSINRVGDRIHIDFGQAIQWAVLTPPQAVDLAHKLIEYAMGMEVSVHIAPKLDESLNPMTLQDQPQPPLSDAPGK